ncbi:MAG TPA: sodium/solute symporter, partial [bacterium]|nr:sodium/solute symporter [bacterium]
GKKVWRDDVYVLEKTSTGQYQWHIGFRLPRALAHGASVSTERGVVCIGGCDAERCYSDVFVIRWDSVSKTIDFETLPALPQPCAFGAAVVSGKTVFVAGGQSTMLEAFAMRQFWSLDLTDGSQWQDLPQWNGSPRILPVLAAQNFQDSRNIYLFSGRDVAPNRDTILLKDVHRYDPATQIWTQLSDAPRCLMAGMGVGFGAQHILLVGGDDGENWGKDLRDTHPGFAKDMVFAYHTLTDTWVQHGTLPQNHVTTSLIRWGDAFIIPTGEIRPAVRSDIIWKATPEKSQQNCQPLDYIVIVLYLLALIGVGVYCAKREKTTDDFFLAGRRIPWWAAGLSIFGTQLSAITFMAIPAKTYSSNWLTFLFNMGIVAITPLIVFFFLPFYRRLNVTTAYEYLERRFSVTVRVLGSALFLAFQLGRIGIVLLLPSLALSVVTGVNVYFCILIMGVLATVYTVMGGIEAVIWTDVFQVFVLVGGAVWCLLYATAHVSGGISGVFATALAENKFHWVDWNWDLGRLTIWVIVLGWINSLLPYASDQTVIQRYLTTKDEKAARQAIWTNAILTVPASLLFFSLGTALFVFYKNHPNHLDPGMAKVDNILPWFVMRELPAGVSGLVIAAVFAASMSTLDSSMNSMATAVVTDFCRRFRRNSDEAYCL